MSQLPPLPKPQWLGDIHGYTEAQLLAHQAAVVEACAKAVESLERNGAWITKVETLDAIRSMK